MPLNNQHALPSSISNISVCVLENLEDLKGITVQNFALLCEILSLPEKWDANFSNAFLKRNMDYFEISVTQRFFLKIESDLVKGEG